MAFWTLNKVSAKDEKQDKILNQIKLKINDSYKKDEKKQQVLKMLMMKTLQMKLI